MEAREHWAISLTDSSLVVAVREASKRILGTGRSNQKEPMPPGLLKGIVDRAVLSDGLELRNVCRYLLCFGGFLRLDDVSRESKEIKSSFITVTCQSKSERAKTIN